MKFLDNVNCSMRVWLSSKYDTGLSYFLVDRSPGESDSVVDMTLGNLIGQLIGHWGVWLGSIKGHKGVWLGSRKDTEESDLAV